MAKRRLADDYDAAQDRGEVAKAGGDRSKIPEENFATAGDIGLTQKEIHEARTIRDAEDECPGIVRRTLDALFEVGERRGRPTADIPENFPEYKGKETRDLAAKRAGFGNAETYRQAKSVTTHGAPELVEAASKDKILSLINMTPLVA